jgi:cytochrome c5
MKPLPSLFSPGELTTASAGSFSAIDTYQQFCVTCHEGGRYNAPARGNIESWECFPRDINLLVDLAIQGKGAMIPKGGCQQCSNEELQAVIEYMLPVTWKK